MNKKIISSLVITSVSLFIFAGLALAANTDNWNLTGTYTVDVMVNNSSPPASVSAMDNSFSPKDITVPAGTTITWTNNGTMHHTVTADDSSFNSGILSPGDKFSHTFDTPGTYPYHCMFHGAVGGVGMSGTVTVTKVSVTEYMNTMNISSTDPETGDFSGNGYYNPDHSIMWNVSGKVSGPNLTFDAISTGVNASYTVSGSGTIADDGTMSGTGAGSDGQQGTWKTTSGNATHFESGGGGQESDIEAIIASLRDIINRLLMLIASGSLK